MWVRQWAMWNSHHHQEPPGFFHTRDTLVTFQCKHTNLLIAVFSYLALTHSAMPVALQANLSPAWFATACRGFSFSIILLIISQIPLYVLLFLLWVMLQLVRFFARRRLPQLPKDIDP